ncbi:MAG: GntR family transcriptional regulator [Calothrix sp. MO_167.B12]|nr:GntR family transcriptional regulator [Calothrix sp. MO_167.B12]
MGLSELAANVLPQQRSTPDLIADALREAIIQGILQPGESLRQDEIAKQFGVSRIPVREALRQLEVEGLVNFYAHRGAVVSALSPAEVEEIGEIRVALETTAIKLAIPNLTEFDLEKAQYILDTTVTETDVARLGELNWEFHTTLYSPANRPRLLGIIKNLHMNIERYVRLQMTNMNYAPLSHKEHEQLLNACRQKDTSTAVRLLKRHIGTATKELVKYLVLVEKT